MSKGLKALYKKTLPRQNFNQCIIYFPHFELDRKRFNKLAYRNMDLSPKYCIVSVTFHIYIYIQTGDGITYIFLCLFLLNHL